MKEQERYVPREDGIDPTTIRPILIGDDPEAKVLTAREREVAILLALGYSCAEIGPMLGCSVKTVDTHRHHMLTKLKLRGAVDLARHALRSGWVSL